MLTRTKNPRVISWFSCGAASAVATKLALKKFDNVEICYQDTGSEHPDNVRFLADCEEWFGQKIIKLKSDKYENIWDVFERTRYLVGTDGARCTGELKRKVAESFLWSDGKVGALEIMGFTFDKPELKRVKRFQEQNNERNLYPILVDKQLTKKDCLGMLNNAGIEIPTMYKLGYKNNNCLGCPKAGMGTFNLLRKTHPEIFDRMARVERDLNVSCIRVEVKGQKEKEKLFLDELEPNRGHILKEPDIECGIICMQNYDEIEDDEL